MALAQESLSYPRGLKESDFLMMDHQGVLGLNAGKTLSGGSVKITEYYDTNVNPEPINQEEKADEILEDYLSPARLRSISGHRNLEDVTTLEMKVNTTDTSLSSLGQMLPNLRELKLSNSVITSVRDLGTSLSSLKILWMTRCGLCDLDGISTLAATQELYLAFNEIVDVSPLSMLDNLEVLDLEGNMVEDITQVHFLAMCSSLNSLTLEANPVCSSPHPDASEQDVADYRYRDAILKGLPQLRMLDSLPILFEKVNGETVVRELPESISQKTKIPEHLMDDFLHVTENLRIIDMKDDSDDSSELGERPRSALSKRPGSAAGVRPSTARNRPGTAARRPDTSRGQRPGTAAGEQPTSASGVRDNTTGVIQEDDSSSLTHGSNEVICGNISRALRARKKHLPVVSSSPEESTSLFKFTPEKSYAEESESIQSKEEIFEELNRWRQEYAKMLDEERQMLNRSHESESSSPAASPRREQPSSSPTSPMTPTPSAAHSPSPPVTPSPPPSASRRVLPNPMQRSLPLPPQASTEEARPRTAADFRIRRYRQRSVDRPVHTGDESFDAEVSQDFDTPRVSSASAHSSTSPALVEPRSSSAPIALGKKHRVLPPAPMLPSQQDAANPTVPPPVRPVHLYRQRPGTAAVLEKRRIRPLNDPRLSKS